MRLEIFYLQRSYYTTLKPVRVKKTYGLALTHVPKSP